jgi:glycosyltransferase involved in cell wall biosynthesis
MSSWIKVAAVVVTLDEEPNIKDCLKQLKPFVDYIIVVDGGSKDKTVEIASKYAHTIEVGKHGERVGDERNYGWSLVPEDAEWVLFVDADERFNITFLRGMRDLLSRVDALAFRFPRANLPKLSDYPDWQTRLLRNDGQLEWRSWEGDHDIPFSKELNIPVDRCGTACLTLIEYPMYHLPRREDIKRRWWSSEEEKDEK